MEYRTHGGHCCGYGHVSGFDGATEQDLIDIIRQHYDAARGENRILEAILTGRQLSPGVDDRRVVQSVRDAGGWITILAQRGFRLAAEWTNSNTGRNCYQFLLIRRLKTDDPNYVRPFEWPGQVEARPLPPVVVPDPTRIVRTDFIPIYNDENRVTYLRFPSLAVLREQLPRVRRYKTIETFSNGYERPTPIMNVN